jgi:hypothetical protein
MNVRSDLLSDYVHFGANSVIYYVTLYKNTTSTDTMLLYFVCIIMLMVYICSCKLHHQAFGSELESHPGEGGCFPMQGITGRMFIAKQKTTLSFNA